MFFCNSAHPSPFARPYVSSSADFGQQHLITNPTCNQANHAL